MCYKKLIEQCIYLAKLLLFFFNLFQYQLQIYRKINVCKLQKQKDVHTTNVCYPKSTTPFKVITEIIHLTLGKKK